MKKLWVISDIYWPSATSTGFILKEIVDKLKESHDVTVITANPSIYGLIEGVTSTESSEEVLHLTHPRSKKGLRRLWYGLLFTIRAIFLLKRYYSNGDKIFCVTNPFLLIAFLPHFFPGKTIFLIHDVFPENIISTGNRLTSILGRLIKPIFDSGYKKVRELIVLGTDMKQVVDLKSGKQSIIISNWGEADLVPSEFNESDKIRILFAGNIGKLQALDLFLEWFIQLDPKKYELIMIGDGVKRDVLEDKVRKEDVNNVIFLGTQSRTLQNKFLNEAHLCLVSLNKNMFGLGVPSKTYNIMMCGRPILYFGPSGASVDNLINEHQIGLILERLVIKRGVIVGLETVNDLKKQFDPKIISEKGNQLFSKSQVLKSYEQLFENVR